MATLDYSSVRNWMAVTIEAVRWFDAHQAKLDLDNEQDQKSVLVHIATYARSLGFNVKVQNRSFGVLQLVSQLDPRLEAYWHQHHQTTPYYDKGHQPAQDTSWMDVPKPARRAK